MTGESPRTATRAGSDLLAMLETHDADDLNMEARVRAIEAEAAQGAAAPPDLDALTRFLVTITDDTGVDWRYPGTRRELARDIASWLSGASTDSTEET